jgi:hypothetical protein
LNNYFDPSINSQPSLKAMAGITHEIKSLKIFVFPVRPELSEGSRAFI